MGECVSDGSRSTVRETSRGSHFQVGRFPKQDQCGPLQLSLGIEQTGLTVPPPVRFDSMQAGVLPVAAVSLLEKDHVNSIARVVREIQRIQARNGKREDGRYPD